MTEHNELNLEQMEQVAGGRKGSNILGDRKWIKYHVMDGDTLWSIKKKFNCSISDIKKWNNLKSERLEPGMVLDLYTDRN